MLAKSITGCLAVVTVALCAPAVVQAQPSGEGRGELRAGASRVDCTPSGAQLPRNFVGVLDRIYVRSLVVDNGRHAGSTGHGGCGRDFDRPLQ